MATEKVIRIDTRLAQEEVETLEKSLQAVNDQLSKLDKSSKAFTDLSKKAGDLNKQIASKKNTGFEKLNTDLQKVNNTAQQTSMDLGQIASNMAKVGAGISGGFAIANTALQLFGVESEEATKAVQKLQSLLLLPISFTAFAEGIQALKPVKSAVTDILDSIKEGFKDIKGLSVSRLKNLFDAWLSYKAVIETGKKLQYEKDRNIYIELGESIEKAGTAMHNFAKKESKAFLHALGNVGKVLGRIVLTVTPAIVAAVLGVIRLVQKIKFDKAVNALQRLDLQIQKMKNNIDNTAKSFENYYKKLDQVDAIDKQIKALENLNNTYRQYILNRKEEAVIDKELAAQQSDDVLTITGAYTTLKKVLKSTSIKDLAKGIIPGQLTIIDSDKFKTSTVEELRAFAKSIVNESEEIASQISPEISRLQNLLAGAEYSLSQKDLAKGLKNELELRKTSIQTSLNAYTAYYDALQQKTEEQLKAIEEEIKYRQLSEALTIEEKKNAIAVYKAETERRKATIENYELTAEYFDRTVKAYNDEIALAKKGSAEEANLIAQREAFIQGFRKDFEKEFQESFRKTEAIIEEVDADMEKALSKMYEFIKGSISAWQQLTGDTRTLDDSFISKLIETGQWEGFKELVGLTIEANNQFNNLIATINRFGESSLGLGTQWTNVIADMQTTFNSFALAISKGSKASFSDWGNAVANVSNMTGTLLNALSDEQDTNTKEGFEQQKKFQISATVVNMLGGILSAWSSAMSPANAWMTGIGQIALGAAMSTTIAGIGAAQIAKIAKQQFGSSASASSNAINSTIIPPVTYSKLVNGANIEGSIKDTRQFVSVVEIDKVQKRVNVSENEARY